jgi:hypothetical protein
VLSFVWIESNASKQSPVKKANSAVDSLVVVEKARVSNKSKDI